MREPRRRGRCWTTSSAGWLASPRMRRTSGYARLAPIACVILLGAGGARVQSERWPLTRFAEHDVSVEIALERSRSGTTWIVGTRSEEHTSELQSPCNLVCRLLLEKKKIAQTERPTLLLGSRTLPRSALPLLRHLAPKPPSEPAP